MILRRPAWLLAPFSITLAACEGVLGIQVLPAPDAGLDGGGGAGDAGQPESCADAPCPPSAPVCSGQTCTHVARLAGGLGHQTCAVLGDGTLRCWGWNETKQIGAPFEGPYAAVPQVVAGIAPVERGSASRLATCVVLESGAGRCWGENEDAQLGAGPSGPASSEPVAVALEGIAQLAAGTQHTCARTRAGAVHCWGDDTYGQLGHGTIGASSVAPGRAVDLPLAATALCSGSLFSCASGSDGAMWCWGDNKDGVLADGMVETASGSPHLIPITDVVDVACGNLHACALTRSSVACWGNNDGGQTGSSTKVDVTSPFDVALPPGPPVVELRVGWRHSCALREDGEVLCWGRNTVGQLGDGRFGSTFDSTPGFVVGLPAPARDLSSMWQGNCAALEDGTVRCWGQADVGQLGNGGTPDLSSTPVTVGWSE